MRALTPAGRLASALFVALSVQATDAEITSITATAEAFIQELRNGLAGDRTRASDAFPTTQSELPLQVVATFVSEQTDEPAAAAVAAQFADPRDLDQPNPEEFAINLSLNSLSPDVRYEGEATLVETRGILFSAGEIENTAEGDVLELTGRLFIDGALAIVSSDASRDLSGARVFLTLRVEQIDGQGEPVERFAGEVSLMGAAGGGVTVGESGDFPLESLVFTDLSNLDPNLPVFRLLILPDVTIDYLFSATVGEPTTLRVTLEVQADSLEGDVGVAAIIGTPSDAVTDVFSQTLGSAPAQKIVTAMLSERDDPTGPAAFPDAGGSAAGLCPTVGFASLAGLSLAGLLARRRTP